MEHEASPWLFFYIAILVMIALSTWAVISTRRLNVIPDSGRQAFVEAVVESLNNFVVGIMGSKGEKYTPFIGTLFIYILVMNLIGLVPGMKSPTGNLSITASLAVVVFVFYNIAGIREVGAKKYLKHLMGEPIWMAPFMLPIHLISELARPLSLSVRLYGNIFGDEMVLAVLASLSLVVVPYAVGISGQPLMLFFGVFTSVVQALVFTILSAIFISIAISDAEHA